MAIIWFDFHHDFARTCAKTDPPVEAKETPVDLASDVSINILSDSACPSGHIYLWPSDAATMQQLRYWWCSLNAVQIIPPVVVGKANVFG